MSEVEELESRVRTLPPEDLAKFREWFIKFEDELWDHQIAADFRAGKFDQLIAKARAEMVQGRAKEI
ncbi:MAG: hypothetical protein HY759_03900 [Nitrospirae bacterium]|nr:hypothetical protein [Nitrospirota bacterium]